MRILPTKPTGIGWDTHSPPIEKYRTSKGNEESGNNQFLTERYPFPAFAILPQHDNRFPRIGILLPLILFI